jgi:hypothetical protein
MTDRERWTIYPLLVLSIGMQLRDKFLPATSIRTQSLHCQSLTVGADSQAPRLVVSPQGVVQLNAEDKKPRIILGAVENKGVLQVLAADNKPRILVGTADNNAGVVDVHGADGERRVAMLVDEGQQVGSLATFGDDGQRRVIVAAGDGGGGLVTVHGPGGHQLVALGMGKPLGGLVTSPAATNNEQEQPAAEPPPQGGQLALFSAEGKPQWLLTHDERGAGRALAFDEQGHLFLVLMATLNVTPGPPGRSQPGAQPAPEGSDDRQPAPGAGSPETAPPAEPATPPTDPPAPPPAEPPAEAPATDPAAAPTTDAPAAPSASEAGDLARP